MAMLALRNRKALQPRKILGFTFIGVVAFMMGADIALSGETTTTVTTYVVRTQEEREQTRWSLTEWLKIKERSKLMDVWLAMFSDPKKDRFRPEMNVSVMATRSTMQRKLDRALIEDGTGQGKTARAQVFLTNLVSSKVGIRTLNLDLGFEAGGRDSGSLTAKVSTQSAQLISSSAKISSYAKSNWYALDLRLFGKHIQDSSIVLKYGLLNIDNSMQMKPNVDVAATPASSDSTSNSTTDSTLASGTTIGSEIQLYLTKNIGIEILGHQHRATFVAFQNHTLTGTYGEGLGFIEIGILRIQGGIYEERWLAKWQQQEIDTIERGYVGGLKILL